MGIKMVDFGVFVEKIN